MLCPTDVELIRQQNAGVAASRNAGFENSDSELLLMVDADDRLTLDALDTLRPPLEANPDVGYCYGLMKLIGAWSGVLRFPDFDPYILLHRSIAGAKLGLVRRRCWEDAGGFDPEAIDRLRGLGLLPERAREGLARAADRRSPTSTASTSARCRRSIAAATAHVLPPAARASTQSSSPADPSSRRRRRSSPLQRFALPHLLRLAPGPGAGGEGALLQGRLPEERGAPAEPSHMTRLRLVL